MSNLIEIFTGSREELLVYALQLVKNTHDAEDLVSALLLEVVELVIRGEVVRYPRAYFKTSLRNSANNFIKKKNYTVAFDPDDQQWNLNRKSGSYGIRMIELVMWLDTQLANEPPEIAECFRRHYLDGWPVKELARELGILPNTLSQKFSRILSRMRISTAGWNMFILLTKLN